MRSVRSIFSLASLALALVACADAPARGPDVAPSPPERVIVFESRSFG